MEKLINMPKRLQNEIERKLKIIDTAFNFLSRRKLNRSVWVK